MPFRAAVPWLVAGLLAAGLVLATGYRTRDPDSRVYAGIAERLANEPISRWIAPQWWGAWGLQGLFREHPVGILVAPALLARLGVPAGTAPYVFYLFCQAACVVLLSALAARAGPPVPARLIAWAVLLIPIAFVFRVRANQEYALLAGILLALYGVARAADHVSWAALAVAGFLWALLVKGVFALLAPVYAALWLLIVARSERAGRGVGWAAVAAMAVITPLVALAYERVYVMATGQSFLEYYLGARMALDGAESGGAAATLASKTGSVIWYAGRVLWFAAPWSLALVLAGRVRDPIAARFARFGLASAAVTVLLIAFRDTRADRYVFPAYFLAAAAGVAAAHDRSPRLQALAARLDRWWPWGPAILWLALVAGRVALG